MINLNSLIFSREAIDFIKNYTISYHKEGNDVDEYTIIGSNKVRKMLNDGEEYYVFNINEEEYYFCVKFEAVLIGNELKILNYFKYNNLSHTEWIELI